MHCAHDENHNAPRMRSKPIIMHPDALTVILDKEYSNQRNNIQWAKMYI